MNPARHGGRLATQGRTLVKSLASQPAKLGATDEARATVRPIWANMAQDIMWAYTSQVTLDKPCHCSFGKEAAIRLIISNTEITSLSLLPVTNPYSHYIGPYLAEQRVMTGSCINCEGSRQLVLPA